MIFSLIGIFSVQPIFHVLEMSKVRVCAKRWTLVVTYWVYVIYICQMTSRAGPSYLRTAAHVVDRLSDNYSFCSIINAIFHFFFWLMKLFR